jgi:hypothetical protein
MIWMRQKRQSFRACSSTMCSESFDAISESVEMIHITRKHIPSCEEINPSHILALNKQLFS